MGCGASSGGGGGGGGGEVESEDPMVALGKQIDQERATLKDLERDHENAEAELRFNETALRKVNRVISMMKNDIEDTDSLWDDCNRHIALQDAHDIREASQGWGTDETKMGQVVVSRLPESLTITDEHYQKMYKRTLENQIRGENKTWLGLLTGSLTHFGRFITYRCMDEAKRDAMLLNKAMSGFGCSDYILVEILSTRTNQQLKNAAEAYQEATGKDMVEVIKSETGGFGKKWYGLWVDSLVEFEREEEPGVHGEPEEFAQQLYDAGESKWMGCDEQPFIDILCKANEETCMAIAEAYEALEDSKKSLTEAVEDKMGGDLEFAVLARVLPKYQFFARRIYKACKGWGTDEECIGRVISCLTKQQALNMEQYYNEFYADESAPYNNFRELLAAELSGSFLEAIIFMLDNAAPKGHCTPYDMYDPIAEAAAQEFVENVEGSYASVTAQELGKGPLEGPLMFCGMDDPSGPYGIDQVPSRPPFSHPDRSGLFEDMPVDVDSAQALLEQLVTEQGQVRAFTDSATGNLQGLFAEWGNALSAKAFEMKKNEHYLNQIKSDIESMLSFCASRDADLVKEAADGWGTDEDKLIRVLCALPKEQLRRVDEVYRERYGKSLIEVTDHELGGMFEGDFKYFMKCLLTPPAELDAELLTESMQGWGTNDRLLAELCCTRSNKEIKEARAIFEENEGKSLDEWIDDDTSGAYQGLLLECMKGNRDESLMANEALAAEQAKELHEAGFGGAEIQGHPIINIVANASRAQMKAIEVAYEAEFGKPMAEAIKESMAGDWETALLARCLDKETYYATALNNAFHPGFTGWGTDEKACSRILGRNSKGSVKRVAVRFEEMFGESLHDAIESEVSGNFKKALLTMLFAEAPGEDADPVSEDLDIGGVAVNRDQARQFIQALKDEYLQEEDGAVGKMYEDLAFSDEVAEVLTPEEEIVREAEDKGAAIDDLIHKYFG